MSSDPTASHGHDALPADAVRSLRESLERHLTDSSNHDELTAAVRRFSREARDRRLPPERVLAQLHDLLDDVVACAPSSSIDERRSLRARLVSLCIEHYFAVGLVMSAALACMRKAQ